MAAARASLGMSPFDPRQPLRTSLCETVLYCRSRACPPKVKSPHPFLSTRTQNALEICCWQAQPPPQNGPEENVAQGKDEAAVTNPVAMLRGVQT